MIKGWKLNPMWRRYYEDKEKERELNRIAREAIGHLDILIESQRQANQSERLNQMQLGMLQ